MDATGQMRYFKKYSPDTVVPLPNGSHVKFDTVDGLIGFHATNNTWIQSEFERAMREQRCGISEITAAEFQEFLELKKNNPNRPRHWREEFGKQSPPVRQLDASVAQAAVGVNKPNPAAVVAAAEAPAAPVAPAPVYKPRVGRRMRKPESNDSPRT